MNALGSPAPRMVRQRRRLEAGSMFAEELRTRPLPHLPSRRSTSFSSLTLLAAVVLCGLLVDARSATGSRRALLDDKDHQPEFVAQGVRNNAKKIEHAVDGIKKAVDSVKLEIGKKTGPADDTPKLESSPAAHDKLQGLASSEEKMQKMKAAVHAAAMIKQNAILHQHHAEKEAASTGTEAGKEDEGKGGDDDAGERGRKKVITLHQPKWFAEGPYVIIALLVSIFFTFCYCACSSQPTSMSNKYDMR